MVLADLVQPWNGFELCCNFVKSDFLLCTQEAIATATAEAPSEDGHVVIYTDGSAKGMKAGWAFLVLSTGDQGSLHIHGAASEMCVDDPSRKRHLGDTSNNNQVAENAAVFFAFAAIQNSVLVFLIACFDS